QKYTTDGLSAAMFKGLIKACGLEYQSFANRSDMPGGSTLGNISAGKVAVNTVDIGLPQLAMHSSFETAGAKDTQDFVKVCKLHFSE
ncbi:MAG: M18 family aminopeptidase, partial [Oscillospiraceae bacterium]